MCSVSSRAGARRGIQELMEIIVVAVPVIVISDFHRDHTDMEHTFLHWSKLTKCNYEKKLQYLEFIFNPSKNNSFLAVSGCSLFQALTQNKHANHESHSKIKPSSMHIELWI